MRWSHRSTGRIDAPRVDIFLAEVVEVCRKHGFSIGHEDTGGAFVVDTFDDNTAEWLLAAHVGKSIGLGEA